MNKVINNKDKLITEMIEGIISAYNGKVKQVDGQNAIVKIDIPENKIALVVGGGSGHEPAYHGLVGNNMADGAAIGNIFASPNPEVIMKCAESVHRGRGVLFLYGNYSGDVMNFDLAAELLEEQGISCKTVLIKDDVAVKDNTKRRGIAGLILISKVAGAVCASVSSLEEVRRITQKASDNTASIGVALEAGTMLNTGEKMFDLLEGEIEIGLGLHGEPGVKKGSMQPANQLVEEMMNEIFSNIPLQNNDEVVLLVNDLGSMTGMELFIVNHVASKLLSKKGIYIYKTLVGRYSTSMDMRGFSISLMKLDEELRSYFSMPASSLALTIV